MKVLIIGSGGREHALAWKFSISKHVSKVFVAPGNDGMDDVATCINIDINDTNSLIKFALDEKIDLTVVGPEQALVNGIVDEFTKVNFKVFGPNKDAAMIEGSKRYAKKIMKKYNIPTAKYEAFNNYIDAVNYVNKIGVPIVIKADGLASGKGVIVAFQISEAINALNEILNNNKFGKTSVIIEEYLEGEEFSLMAFVNGDKVYPMKIAQDHKRAYDNDLGPNTGGMGAYCPVPQISEDIINDAINNIMIPTAKALLNEGNKFIGVLYGGLILTKEGPKVIEFNARFGDPETEVVIPLLKNDLYEVIIDILANKEVHLEFYNKFSIGVVMASKGYPNDYEKGYVIEGLETLENVHVFHMSTKREKNNIVTNGGRVLFITAMGDDFSVVKELLYNEVKKITCSNLYYRKDIGFKVSKSS